MKHFYVVHWKDYHLDFDSGDYAGGVAHQARELVTKIRRVSGYQHKWKLITVQIGGNDVCSVSCGVAEGDASPKGRCYK